MVTAKRHAFRSDRGFRVAGWLPTGRPHRWQKRACGESSARQPAQLRGIRLAPQALQKLPAPAAPQDGQVSVGVEAVIWARSVTPLLVRVNRRPVPYQVAPERFSFLPSTVITSMSLRD